MSIKPVPLYEELTITTGQLVKMLSISFSKFASKRLLNKHPCVFLLGQPGVGKSQSVYQIASNLGKKTKKQVHVADLRLILFNPVDMRGIPIADLESETAYKGSNLLFFNTISTLKNKDYHQEVMGKLESDEHYLKMINDQISVNSRIASRKFRIFKLSIRLLFIATILLYVVEWYIKDKKSV